MISIRTLSLVFAATLVPSIAPATAAPSRDQAYAECRARYAQQSDQYGGTRQEAAIESCVQDRMRQGGGPAPRSKR